MVFDFGKRLKELRKSRGLTQKRVGEIMGLSTSSIGGYENNFAMPTIDTIKGFAVLYRVSMDYLMGLETENNQTIVLNLKNPEDEAVIRHVVEVLQNDLNKKH